MSDESAVALRILIRATADTPASGDDLANIITNELPDGAECYVLAARVVFRYRKHSALAAVSGMVIAPNAGGGRWVREGTSAGALAAFAASTNLNTAPGNVSSDWVASTTSNYSLQAGLGAFTFAAGGCILTHTGPGGRYLVHVSATLTIADASSAQLGVSFDDDLTGTAAGFAEGINFVELTTGGSATVPISAQRLVTLAPGSTLRPKFRYSAGAALDIERLTLSAIPLP
jgi:hypothetical protein